MHSPTSSAARRARPRVEQLEDREPAAGLQPSALEQAFLERVNDIRAARGTPPLAFDPRAQAVIAQAVPRPGKFYLPGVASAKSALQSRGFRIQNGASLYLQDLGLRVQPGVVTRPDAPPLEPADLLAEAAVRPNLSGLIPLLGVLPRTTHRTLGAATDLATTECHPYRECSDQPLSPPALDLYYLTTAPADAKPIVTGSVFRDGNGNGRYDLGEGLAGVTVRVAGQKATRAFDSGGYTVELRKAGVVQVTVSGGGIAAPITQTVLAARGLNTRLNFVVA